MVGCIPGREGVISMMMTTEITTTKTRGDFDNDDESNNDHKDDDNNDARMFHLCQEGVINWVDGGVTKQQSTNLAYVAAFDRGCTGEFSRA